MLTQKRIGRLALAAVLLVALLAASPAQGKSVKLSIVTRSQAALLQANALEVTVQGAKTTVTLGARQGNATGLVDSVRAKLRQDPTRVRLPLTPRGRQVLGACGPQSVTVEGKYARRAGASGKKRKTRTALVTSRLPAAGGCQVPPAAVASGPDHCDPIDPGNCLLPYPNDYFTVPDPSTGTGLRVDLHAGDLPQNIFGVSTFHPELNRNDGFSPNNMIMTKIPGLQTPDAFQANSLVPQMDIGQYDDPGQRLVLMDADTGQRVPIWAEVDMVPGTPNPHDGGSVNGTVGDRMLLIHPAVQLDYGKRYIVALRDLTDVSSVPLEPNPTFKAYRDAVPTGSAAVEARRPKMESIFTTLTAAGIARDDLYLAWDFTVASEENLTQRLLAMRDDAFAQLGDTDLDDDDVDGASPAISITSSTDLLLCSSDGTSKCELQGADYPGYSGTGPHTGSTYTGVSQSHYTFREIRGTIAVPCYMDAPGQNYNSVRPNVPCAPGSRLHYESGSDEPSQNGNATWQAPFTCIIPRTTQDAPTGATGRPGVVFGHGLLGDNRATEQLGLFPASLEGVACGTDWIGLSGVDSVTGDILASGDLNEYMIPMIVFQKDLSHFSALPDRSQQGFVNALYLGRAMAAADGLSTKPEFQVSGNPALVIDENDVSDDLVYYGASLGGIFGAATTAVAPDWRRAVLSVPGVGFSTLMSRSTQFNQFLPYIFQAYPDPVSRQIGISMLQLVWDRGEPSASLPHLTDDPLPNTPPHQVMIQEAFGDHQVTNIQTETMARTLGASVRTPVVAPGRAEDPLTDAGHPGVDPFLFSDTVNPFYTPDQDLLTNDDLNDPGGYTGASAVSYTLDTGPIRTESGRIVGSNPNLDWNIAPLGQAGLANPNDGLDPHGPGATAPAAQEMAIPFLLEGSYYDPCVTPEPPMLPPWTTPFTGTPVLCPAPPLSSDGQGQ